MHTPQRRYAVACQAVVIWIDWYAYHLARFQGLQASFGTDGEIVGMELVGGVGVHQGLTFREGRSDELPVETLLPASDWRNASKVALSRMLWHRLSTLNPQIVLVPGYYTLPAVAAALWARWHGRVSVLMTESTEQDHARSTWKETLKSLLIRRLFDWAVTGGNAHVRYLQALRFPADRIVSFYNVVGNDTLRTGVSAMRSTSNAADHGLPAEYLLYIGRLSPEKNVHGLLRAWAAYRANGGHRALLLVGDGELAADLRSAAAATGFGDAVHFAGHKSSRELWPCFAFASAFVLPSTREPWGLVVNEAMAAGLPVFVSNRCGCAENLVEHGTNGYTFDPTNDAELTELFHNFDRCSPQQRSDMGEESDKRIAAYSPVAFGMQIAEIARRNGVTTRAESNGKQPPLTNDLQVRTDQQTQEGNPG